MMIDPKELKRVNDKDINHVTIFGIGVQRNRDYVIMHGYDMENKKEYWFKVSINDITEANERIMDFS